MYYIIIQHYMTKVKEEYQQLSLELHKPVTKKFQRIRVTVKRIDEIFGADLVDMNE
jgi:hypothetical protein